MKIQIDNIKTTTLLFFDIEFDQNELIQFAGLTFEHCGSQLYKLVESVNIYLKPRYCLNKFFSFYTGITDEFIADHGLTRASGISLIQEFLTRQSTSTIYISHGIRNDIKILRNNGISFEPQNRYCTYEKAKQLLNRDEHLTLADVAIEDGYSMFNLHNAYADVGGTLHAFLFLNEKENEESYGKVAGLSK